MTRKDSKPIVKICKVCKAETVVIKLNGKKLKQEDRNIWEVYINEVDLSAGKSGIEKFCHKCGSLLWIPYIENEEVYVILHTKSR